MTEYRASWTVSFTSTLLEAAIGGRWLDREIKEEMDRLDAAVEAVGGSRGDVSYTLTDVRFDDREEEFGDYGEMEEFLLARNGSDYEVSSVEAEYSIGDAELDVSYNPFQPKAFTATLAADDEDVRSGLEEELSQPFYRTGWRRLFDMGRRWRV